MTSFFRYFSAGVLIAAYTNIVIPDSNAWQLIAGSIILVAAFHLIAESRNL